MRTNEERVRQYRSRAEELRTLAELWSDAMARESLGRVARDYDHLADSLECNLRGRKPEGLLTAGTS